MQLAKYIRKNPSPNHKPTLNDSLGILDTALLGPCSARIRSLHYSHVLTNLSAPKRSRKLPVRFNTDAPPLFIEGLDQASCCRARTKKENQVKNKRPEPQLDTPVGTICLGEPSNWFSIITRIEGDQLDPDEITNLLSLNPIQCYKKGEKIDSKDGAFISFAKTGLWQYEYSPDKTNEWDCNYAIVEAFSILKEYNPENLVAIAKKYSITIYVSLGLESENSGFYLKAETIKMLSMYNAKIEFDIYAKEIG
jgi:hypothetical protein